MQQVVFLATLALLATYTASICNLDINPTIQPCFCRLRDNIICNNKDLSLEQAANILRNRYFKSFNQLQLKGMDLKRMDLTHLRDVSFHWLKIIRCNLDGIDDSSVRTVPELTRIRIDDSIKTPDFQLRVRKLRGIRILEMAGNVIRSVRKNWFSRNLDSLLELRLEDNQIEEVEDGAFQYLGNLKSLNLEKNNIRSLKTSILPPSLPRLEKLYLGFNRLEELPAGFLSNMLALRHLDLRSNAMKELSANTFGPAWRTTIVIIVIDNPLDCSDAHVNWMAENPHLPLVSGRCAGPVEREPFKLETLIRYLKKEFTLSPYDTKVFKGEITPYWNL